MANRLIKSMIELRVMSLKVDLDTLIEKDLIWIDEICQDKSELAEYQRYYLQQLDTYHEIKRNGNKHKNRGS